MTKIGYNISLGELGAKYNKAKQWAIQSQADFHLLMTVPSGGINGSGDINTITEWKRDLPDSTRILWRTYSTLEGDWVKMLGYNTIDDMWRDDTPAFTAKCQAWATSVVAQWRAEGLKDVLRDDPINEPGLDGGNQKLNERYVIRCVALVNESKKYGFTVAIGAFSVGTPHEQLIDNGTYDPLLEVADVFSVHEYPTGAIGAGDLFGYEAMLDPSTVWGKLPKATWEIASKYWLLRRLDRMYLRAMERFNREIGFIVSETNTGEQIDDAKHVTNQMKQTYGLSECGGDLRGHQAWALYYARVFGNSNLSENVGTMLEYMATYIYNVPHVIGVTLFQMGYGWGRGAQGSYRCHSYIEDDLEQFNNDILPRINAQIEDNDVTIPVFEPTPEPIVFNPPLYDADVSVANGTWNLRANMTTNSSDLGDLTTDAIRMQVSKKTNPANGWNWYKFKWVTDTKTINGYFADTDKLRIEYVADEEQPDTPTTPPDDTSTPDIDLDALKSAILDDLQPVINTAIQDALNSLTESVIVDIPFPNATFTGNTLTLPIASTFARLQRDMWIVIADRLENPTPTTSQVAAQVFDTSQSIVTPLDDYLDQNMSDLSHGNEVMLDVILNSDNVIDDEDVNKKAS